MAAHALGREHAPALERPGLVLLQQNRTHQPLDRRVIGEDADHAGTALDFFVDALEQVGAPDLFVVLGREAAKDSTSSRASARSSAALGNLAASMALT